MLDLLVFGLGVVSVTGVRLVLVRLRRARRSEHQTPNAYLPPPAGHQAVVAAGGCALACSCGWRYALPWPPTSRRVNRARCDHYAAVETERLAQRLGVDAGSVLDRVLTAQRAARQAPLALALEPGTAAQTGAGGEWPRRLEATRSPQRAAQARRASAIARVEAARVLPKYTGDDGDDG